MLTEIENAPEEELSIWAAAQETSSETRSITRQAIVDDRSRVQGYEVLFGIEPHSAAVLDSDAVRTVIDDLVLFGYDRLTRGLPAFIRCTAEVLADRSLEVLPPSLTVVEIPQNLHLSPRLIEACWDLQQAGYRLALVDCIGDLFTHPLLDLVDYIKVDFLCQDHTALEKLRHRLLGKSTILIAENVQWKEDFPSAVNEGFRFFQGPCSPPEPLRHSKIPANRKVHTRILQQLFPQPLNLPELCPLLLRDPSLVYRLLRLANSPVCPIRRKVESLQEAIKLLGDELVRHAIMLAIQCELNAEQASEAVHVALVRARFCQLAAPLANLNPDEQYLLGMMSKLATTLGTSVTTQMNELALRPTLVEALQGATVPERKLVDWIEMLERNQFAECSRIADLHKLDRESLERFYLEAVRWETEELGARRR